MKIVLSCSMKYRDLVREIMNQLKDLGITPIFPNLDNETKNGEAVMTMGKKKQLASDHYAAIDESDAVYFLTPDGYMGTSCKIELGYAIAKNKPVYFSEPTNDIGLDCYVKEFVSINDLKRFLTIIA